MTQELISEATELSDEVIELAKHILHIRKERESKKKIEQPIPLALCGDQEISHGTKVWKVNTYICGDRKYVEVAGYIISVNPCDRTQVELAEKPSATPHRFPTTDQQNSQKRTVVSLKPSHCQVFIRREDAVEYLITQKQIGFDYQNKILKKYETELQLALSLREKEENAI